MINYGHGDDYGKFSDYCTSPMYINKDGTSDATFGADCSSKMGGANIAGALLANSQLDFNDCFANDDGKLIHSKGGKAMESCTCDIGHSICGDQCANTAMRCQCRNKAGDIVVGDIFDIDDHIGVTWAKEHMTNVLVCQAPNGDTVAKYQGCTKNGVIQDTPECPS
ncbi:hypothetical protein SLS64_000302 [Diaporthe eres]|uniref:Cyanovirin-N domain-containing protein n=1 Tax=Diaporthe eres TaxID=83184 RepID=A0ABR1PF57_DIAER